MLGYQELTLPNQARDAAGLYAILQIRDSLYTRWSRFAMLLGIVAITRAVETIRGSAWRYWPSSRTRRPREAAGGIDTLRWKLRSIALVRGDRRRRRGPFYAVLVLLVG